MPPKKKQEALKKKIVDDKTFGLKNKNKSKKVQQYVQQVEQQAAQKVEGPGKRRPGGAGGSSAADAAAQSKKALLAARLEELSLLNQPVAEKKKKVDEEAEERRRRREEEEAERIRIANLPVEEQIEEERAKLTTRTPVTEELFLAWKARKEAERAKRDEATIAAAQKNKSKAERMRGAGLTGRQLFEQHKEIFVDDDEADNTRYERPENDWIGDDEEAAHAAEGTGPRDPDAAQNTPAQEYEPPTADDDRDPIVAQDVGDESLFV
jgi:DRG Family Regulatory Proteins, Tma46